MKRLLYRLIVGIGACVVALVVWNGIYRAMTPSFRSFVQGVPYTGTLPEPEGAVVATQVPWLHATGALERFDRMGVQARAWRPGVTVRHADELLLDLELEVLVLPDLGDDSPTRELGLHVRQERLIVDDDFHAFVRLRFVGLDSLGSGPPGSASIRGRLEVFLLAGPGPVEWRIESVPKLEPVRHPELDAVEYEPNLLALLLPSARPAKDGFLATASIEWMPVLSRQEAKAMGTSFQPPKVATNSIAHSFEVETMNRASSAWGNPTASDGIMHGVLSAGPTFAERLLGLR